MIEKALAFAAQAHAGKVRKISGIPYILHPMEVASIIGTLTTDTDVMIAGLLHDTIEDAGVLPEEIREMFGERVLMLVESETEERIKGEDKKATWEKRKNRSLDRLAEYDDIDVKILWLGDKLSNIRSFYREWRDCGDDVWLRLNMKDKTKHEAYYRRIADLVSELRGTAAYEEYMYLLDKLFGGENNG